LVRDEALIAGAQKNVRVLKLARFSPLDLPLTLV